MWKITLLVLGQLILSDGATTNNGTMGIPAVLTTSGGALVEYSDTDSLNSDLISNEYFIDSMSHLMRERIPERVVHARGSGAFGYFTVTNDISSICRAKLFSEVGKTTPIVMRFSLAFAAKGALETTRGNRGYAVKFYTEDGNFDIAGFNTPIAVVKDPGLVPSLTHVVNPSPVSNVPDTNMLWDFLTTRTEAMFMFFYIFGDPGIPDGYRHMPGFSVHTYQVVNDEGVSSFVRFHFRPDAGEKNLSTEEATAIGGADPNYFTRDLFNAIDNGTFPSWTMSVQILSMEDIKNASIDVFDVTKMLPLDQYPLTEVGKLVLNRNPTNYFASMEQLAFCPGNLVPGIVGAPDKFFEARRLFYRDAQNYRLGANYQNIEVNLPLQKANDYTRDGLAPVNDNGGDGPNYYPNSFDGPEPYVDENRVELLKAHLDDSKNIEQITHYYTNEMAEDERGRFVQNVVASLSTAHTFLQERAVTLFTTIQPELGSRIKQALGLE